MNKEISEHIKELRNALVDVASEKCSPSVMKALKAFSVLEEDIIYIMEEYSKEQIDHLEDLKLLMECNRKELKRNGVSDEEIDNMLNELNNEDKPSVQKTNATVMNIMKKLNKKSTLNDKE